MKKTSVKKPKQKRRASQISRPVVNYRNLCGMPDREFEELLKLKEDESTRKEEQAKKISVKRQTGAPKKRQKRHVETRKPQIQEQPKSAVFSAELPKIPKPKLPKTAYSFFADDHRAMVIEEKGKFNLSYN